MSADKLTFFNSNRCPTTCRQVNSNEHHDCGLPLGHLPFEQHQCSVCGLVWTGLTLFEAITKRTN